jgi:glutamyl-tRNA synthetase
VGWFDLAGVGRSPSRFDLKKLENLNGHYLRAADDGRLVGLIAPRVAAGLGRELAEADLLLLHRTMPELKKRASNLNELANGSLFFLRNRPIPMDEGAAKLLASATPGLLDRARARFAAQTDWTAAALEQVARDLAESEAAKLGQIAQPLRAAVTGSTQSPGLFEVLEVLGKDEVLGRIDDALAG